MMKPFMNRALCAAAVLFLAACSNEISKSASPVELIATNTQQLFTLDVAPGAPNCNRNVGTIEMQVITKNPSSGTTNTTFNQVRIQSYTVSYVRTDGGKLVPAPFTNAMDSLLTPNGGATGLSNFQGFRPEALNQAPFAALLPQNGGRDPDTKQSTIHMDVVVTINGQTLAGENVSASTRFPLGFCYNCGGCA